MMLSLVALCAGAGLMVFLIRRWRASYVTFRNYDLFWPAVI
jgi:hypothetical protein